MKKEITKRVIKLNNELEYYKQLLRAIAALETIKEPSTYARHIRAEKFGEDIATLVQDYLLDKFNEWVLECYAGAGGEVVDENTTDDYQTNEYYVEFFETLTEKELLCLF